MTSSLDQLLAKARLVPAPYTQAEIEAAVERVAARVGARLRPGGRTPHPATPRPEGIPAPQRGREAAQNLRTLCETVLAQNDALAHLRLFLARSMPEPPGARVLGCILHLTSREDSAQFWWQYAAGAGDTAATYCLYLHHLALGESGEAHWWHDQADVTPAVPGERSAEEETEQSAEEEIAIALRVLRTLKTGKAAVPGPVSAVLEYVPVAVGFVDDDLDLPLPDPDFADRIQALTVAPAVPQPHHRCSAAPLPERKPGHRGSAARGVPAAGRALRHPPA